MVTALGFKVKVALPIFLLIFAGYIFGYIIGLNETETTEKINITPIYSLMLEDTGQMSIKNVDLKYEPFGEVHVVKLIRDNEFVLSHMFETREDAETYMINYSIHVRDN